MAILVNAINLIEPYPQGSNNPNIAIFLYFPIYRFSLGSIKVKFNLFIDFIR